VIEEQFEASAPATAEVTFTVNGERRTLTVRTHHTLLDVLRNQVGLIGTREGCGIGMCGACTVLVDGKIVSGCLTLAPAVDGTDVVTVEGLLGNDGELHPVQQAFVDHTGFQCSYCTPGFILAAKALLEEEPDPSRDEAKDYLAGNLCRCGSYLKIEEAVMDAAARLRGEGIAAGT
jgi:carbon-monoxide dehydrogenase small subunit